MTIHPIHRSSLWLLLLVLSSHRQSRQVEASQLSFLNSLQDLDALRQNATISRVQNVDVIQSSGGNNGSIALCRLDYLIPFSRLVQTPRGMRRVLTNQIFQVEGAAAMALAAEHLNTGNGSIIKQVDGLDKRCNVRFNIGSIDTMWSQKVGVDKVIEATKEDGEQALPCAIMGDVLSRVSMNTAMITGLRGYMQMGYHTATELEDRVLFPLSTRITPSLEETVAASLQYIYEELGARHLAVLHTNTRDSQSYSVALQQAHAVIAPDLELISFDIPDDVESPEVYKQAVAKLKATGFTYLVAAIKNAHLDPFFAEAHEQGIAGTGRHNWFVPGSAAYYSNPRRFYERGSPQALAFQGIQVVTNSGYFPHPVYNKFDDALKELGNSPADVEYLRSKLPQYPDIIARNGTDIFRSVLQDGFLQSRFIGGMMSWAYDSVIAAGVAACNATKDETYFGGEDHFQALTGVAFEGATGNITFDPMTGTRQNGQKMIINVQIDDERSNETHIGFIERKAIVVVDGQFQQVQPVIFNDGTTNIPPDLPPVSLDENHLQAGLLIMGWTLCALIFALATTASIWTFCHRKSRVVLRSQPIFLHILCIGTIILGSSIIPMSIDEGKATIHGCNIACQTFPWLISVGFSIMFSALWAKTHRINTILQNPSPFKRVSVSAFDVAKPMLAILGANIVVLSVWTFLSPLQRETSIVDTDRFGRPIETRGYCASDDSLAYLIALGVVNLGPVVLATYEAYVARHVSTEFAESEYILMALVVILLVCFIGTPVLVIAHDNPSANFFVSTAIVFVVSISTLLLIFCPKCIHHYYNERETSSELAESSDAHRQQQEQRRRSSVIPERFARNLSIFQKRSSHLAETLEILVTLPIQTIARQRA